MYFKIDTSRHSILKRIASQDQRIFSEALDLIPVHERGEYGYIHTVLSVACQTQSLTYVNQLLNIRDIQNNAEAFENRALEVAASLGHIDLVTRLLRLKNVKEELNDVNSDFRCFAYPIEKKYWNVVEYLLSVLQPKNIYPLAKRILINDPVDIDPQGFLRLYAKLNFRKAVNQLLLTQSEQVPKTLISSRNWGLFEIFLDNVPNIAGITDNNNEALKTVIKHQKIQLLNKLLRRKNVMTMIDADEESEVLIEAIKTRNKTIIGKLLEIDSVKQKATRSNIEELLNTTNINLDDSIVSSFPNETFDRPSFMQRNN